MARQISCTILPMRSKWPLIALGLLCACSRRGDSSGTSWLAGDSSAKVPGEWFGCSARLEDGPSGTPRCEVNAERIVRFTRHAEGVTFETDASAPTVRLEGKVYVVTVPPKATVVYARLGALRAALSLEDAAVRPWATEAKSRRASGDLDGARQQTLPATTSADIAERAAALSLLARIELARGDINASVDLFRKAIPLHRTSRHVSDAVDDSFALSFALVERSQRYTEAKAALDEQASLLSMYPEGRARDPYYRALIATDLGDVRGAMSLLDDAGARADTLELVKLHRNIESARALLLLHLGRIAESRTAMEKLRSHSTSPCERAEDDINVAYAELVARETQAPAGSGDTPERLLKRVAIDPSCADTYLKALAWGNLAYAFSLRDDVDGTLNALSEARKHAAKPKLEEFLFWLDLEAKAVLARGDTTQALILYDRERDLAVRASMFDEAWRAETGRAELFTKKRDFKAAFGAYAAAESSLDKSSRRIPFSAGRGHYLAGRDRSSRGFLELLLREHREDDAYMLARRSRARVLRTLAKESRLAGLPQPIRAGYERALEAYRRQRLALDAEAADDWKKSKAELEWLTAQRSKAQRDLTLALDDALRALGGPVTNEAPSMALERGDEHTLTLLSFPTNDREYIFARRGRTRVITLAHSGNTKRELDVALAGDIVAADHVRILSSGSLHDDDALADKLSGKRVEYALDLGYTRASSGSIGTTALVFADPRSDLPNASKEGAATAAALRGMNFRVREVSGAAATHGAMAAALTQADFFHYAGHAFVRGFDGWSAELPLAQGGSFTVGDILSLQQTPKVAIVFGCEGAHTAEGKVESLGIAQAFVMNGSYVAVAPNRPIEDASATRFASSFYDSLGKTKSDDIAHRVSAAVASAKRSTPGTGSFRVVVP